jgi:hypothetical protein
MVISLNANAISRGSETLFLSHDDPQTPLHSIDREVPAEQSSAGERLRDQLSLVIIVCLFRWVLAICSVAVTDSGSPRNRPQEPLPFSDVPAKSMLPRMLPTEASRHAVPVCRLHGPVGRNWLNLCSVIAISLNHETQKKQQRSLNPVSTTR